MKFKLKRLAVAGLIAVTASLGATQASAHIVTLGYEALGDGSVDFWFGSYHGFGESPSFEGSLVLTGPGAAGPYAITMSTGTQPTGLIDGINNFIAPTYSGGFGAVAAWQGVNVTGLSDGIFSASFTGATGAKWTPWPTFLPTSISVDVVETPEPGALALFGLGLLGLGAARRRKRRAA